MRKFGLLFALLLVPALGFAADLNVPSGYATIMDAINAASPGDNVLVAPGIYVENVDFLGKAITVKSTDGPLVTTIDGTNWTNPDYLSTVVFKTGEGASSILEGFTVTGGHGSLGAWGDYHGGGIHITDSSPTIQYNIITGNSVEGLYSGGGGVHGYHTSATLIGNVITSNYSSYSGGGFDCTGDDPTLMNNVIIGNKTGGDNGGTGGGMSINATDAGTFVNNLIACNLVSVNPGAYSPSCGGVAFWNAGFCYMQNCTVVNNLVIGGSCGGVQSGYNSFPTLSDCVVWNNYADDGSQIRMYAGPSDMTIDYCDVEGGELAQNIATSCNLFWGAGMIDVDPLFATGPDGFFYLNQTSPCVDAGSALASALGLDVYWTRTDEVTDSGTVDLGYHYSDMPVAMLCADKAELWKGSPFIAVDFFLSAGAANGNREYLLLGGATGTVPGTPLPGGATLPLNWDVVTETLIKLTNSAAAMNFYGKLSPEGTAIATLDPPIIPPSAVGVTVSFAYVLLDYPALNVVSNATNIIVVE